VVGTDDPNARRPDPRVMKTSLRTHLMSPRAIRPLRGLALAATGIVLVTALSACGSSSGSGTASAHQGHSKSAGSTSGTVAADDGTIDSCSLVTEAQLSDIIGTAVTAEGPAAEVARGRACTYSFAEDNGAVVASGTIDIAAWQGSAFFAAGTSGVPRSGIGQQAQDDSEHGIVIFRVDDVVVQVHVISPDHKRASLDIARAAAGQVA
jgi:hypothetical protein